ncbi:MAG: MaoC family dehydratase N-terminal domain-containing protein [Actinomycetes bacterium]
MPLNRDYIGRSYPGARVYEVGREKIREFAAAIGDANPAYVDPDAARALGHPDVIAPPTFAIVITLQAGGQAVFDPGLGLNYALVVHGEQTFVHHRPIRPGDKLSTNVTITDIRDAGRNELMTLTLELTADDGEKVCTAINTIVSRGTATAEATS